MWSRLALITVVRGIVLDLSRGDDGYCEEAEEEDELFHYYGYLLNSLRIEDEQIWIFVMDLTNHKACGNGSKRLFFRMSALFRILHQIGIGYELSAYF